MTLALAEVDRAGAEVGWRRGRDVVADAMAPVRGASVTGGEPERLL